MATIDPNEFLKSRGIVPPLFQNSTGSISDPNEFLKSKGIIPPTNPLNGSTSISDPAAFLKSRGVNINIPKDNISAEPTKSWYEQDGLLQEVVRPFYNIGKDIAQGVFPEIRETQRLLEERKVQAAFDLANKPNLSENQKKVLANIADDKNPMYQIIPERTGTQIAGDIIGAAAMIGTPESFLVKGAGKTLLGKMGIGALKGAIGGGLIGGATEMSKGSDIEKTLEGALIGSAMGGVIGGAIPGIGKATSKVVEKAKEAYTNYTGANPMTFLTSVGKRIEDLGDNGKKFIEQFKFIDTQAANRAGNFQFDLENAPIFSPKAAGEIERLVSIRKLTPAAKRNVMGALEGYVNPQNLTDEEAAILGKVKSFIRESGDELSKAGATVKLSNGQKVPLKTDEFYAPHYTLTVEDITKKTRPYKDAIDYAVNVSKQFETKEAAEKFASDYVTYLKTEGRKGGAIISHFLRKGNLQTQLTEEELKIADALVQKTRTRKGLDVLVRARIDDAIKEAEGKIARYIKPARIPKAGFEYAREVNFPLYDPDIERVATRYGFDSSRRLSELQTWGVGEKELSKLTADIRNEYGKVHGFDKLAEDKNELKNLMDIAMGKINSYPKATKIGLFIRSLQSPKLVFSQIINPGQSISNTTMASDFPSMVKGYIKAMSKEGVALGLKSGATLESTINEIAQRTGESNLASKILKYSGFSATEKWNRIVSANVGVQWVEKNFAKLLKTQGTKEGEVFAKRLAELGINPELALKAGKLDDNMLFTAAKNFSDKTQFRARAIDLPMFANSEAGKVFFQFKNFSYNQSKFIKNEMKKELLDGNYGRMARNLLVLATVFPLTGEALADVRSLVTGSKRPTPGFDRYLDSVAQAGGIGLFADAYSATSKGKVAQAILGPTISTAADVSAALVDDIKNGRITDSQKRLYLNQMGITRPLGNYLYGSTNDEVENFFQTLGRMYNE